MISENFRVFRRTAAYDVLFQIPGRGGQVPPLPPAGAHGVDYHMRRQPLEGESQAHSPGPSTVLTLVVTKNRG